MSWDLFLMKILLKKMFVGLVNSAFFSLGRDFWLL